MSSENIATNTKGDTLSNGTEPTIADVINILSKVASKSDMEEVKQQIVTYTSETNKQMNNMREDLQSVASTSSRNADKIQHLETSVEILKQNQLQNNIVISGVPPELTTTTSANEIVIQIATKLGVQIENAHLSSYTIAKNKFIIAKFFNYIHKRKIVSNLRIKKSLMVEEVFQITSNSQIYINDHLTQHNNKLHLIARTAKKEGILAYVSSSGGKIRVKKNSTDTPTIINTQRELEEIINTNIADELSDNSVQLVDDIVNISATTNTTTATSVKDTSASTSSGNARKKRSQNKTPTSPRKKKASTERRRL